MNHILSKLIAPVRTFHCTLTTVSYYWGDLEGILFPSTVIGFHWFKVFNKSFTAISFSNEVAVLQSPPCFSGGDFLVSRSFLHSLCTLNLEIWVILTNVPWQTLTSTEPRVGNRHFTRKRILILLPGLFQYCTFSIPQDKLILTDLCEEVWWNCRTSCKESL